MPKSANGQHHIQKRGGGGRSAKELGVSFSDGGCIICVQLNLVIIKSHAILVST